MQHISSRVREFDVGAAQLNHHWNMIHFQKLKHMDVLFQHDRNTIREANKPVATISNYTAHNSTVSQSLSLVDSETILKKRTPNTQRH